MNSQDLICSTNTQAPLGGKEERMSVSFTQGEVYKQLIYIQLVHTIERVKLQGKLTVKDTKHLLYNWKYNNWND